MSQGRHNTQWAASETRLLKGSTYRDCSTICVIPTRGLIPAKVMQSWFNLFAPMNQKFLRMVLEGMEVGVAYETALTQILSHPDLSTWKYILTLEEDNLPPPDGLIKLIESLEGGVDEKKYDAMGGLYWTKGEGGQPMIYGVPGEMPLHFRPQPPKFDTVQPCCGLGMGFTLFRTKIFKDARWQRPWFKTEQSWNPGVGARAYTQDLYFFEQAHKLGFKIACDTRVKVGHYDVQGDMVW